MNYARVNFSEIREEIKPMNLAHWDEVTMYKDIPLDPDYDVLDRLEKADFLKTFVARKDDKIVGYALFIVQPHVHYRKTITAVQDVIFIEKAHRGGGLEFINWCDVQLKEMGVNVVIHHVKAEHNWGKALEKNGYKLMDLIYTKRV